MAITTFEIDVNTGDSVKSLSDLRNEFKDIQKQLSGLTPGTEEYVNALKKLGAVKDDIGDLKDEINAFAGADKKIAAVTNVVGGLAGGFQAAQGAAALFGADNEALNETMVKLQATMAITQGIQGLAGMGDSLKAVGNLLKSTTIGTQVATVAQRIYNAVMAANPVGLLVAGLTALVGVIALVVNAMGDETEAMEKSIKQREKELELMNEAAEKLKNENKFRLDLAAAQGKSAKELAAINEAQSANEIKSIDKRVQALKQEILERSNLMKQSDGEELKKLQEANSKSLDEMKKLATERLNIQNSLKIEAAKIETDIKKDAEEKAKEAKEKAEKDAEERRKKIEEEQKWLLESNREALRRQAEMDKEFEDARRKKQEEADKLEAERIEAEIQAEQKRLDKQKADRLKAVEDYKKAKEQEVQLTLQGLTAIQGLADAFAGKSQESQKRAFQIKKAASLAQATIETYQAAQSAYASQMTIPTPDAPIRANIAAAIAIASGLARVAVIAKTKFEGGGAGATGGGGGGNLGSFSQGGGGQPPQGLTAQNTVTQLNPDGSVAGQGERNAAPMKAYVVESESRAVTERVNKLSNNSKIG
jgi:hypothetical protein